MRGGFISESADGGLDVLPIGYLPEDRIAEKSAAEKLDYQRLIEEGCCYPCGDRIINYNFIEEHIRKTAREREMDIAGFGFDRWNCISTANKFENPTDGYEPWIGTIVEQKVMCCLRQSNTLPSWLRKANCILQITECL